MVIGHVHGAVGHHGNTAQGQRQLLVVGRWQVRDMRELALVHFQAGRKLSRVLTCPAGVILRTAVFSATYTLPCA